MNELIKKAMIEGRAILFLGAGASIDSINSLGTSPPLGGELAALIARKVGWSYQKEPLATVYAAARDVLGTQLDAFLESEYKHVKPSSYYNKIAEFPWARIYTINIDDALETALHNQSRQAINVRGRNDRISDKDQLLGGVDYVYLNGSIRRLREGFIFSPEEYGRANADQPLWYGEVASDFLQCPFIFIGTKLDEPVFYHYVELYKKRAGVNAPRSYLLLPSASEIEIASFSSYGLQYIQATLKDFSDWMERTFDSVPTPLEIAKNKIPQLGPLLAMRTSSEQERFAALMQDVTQITRQNISKPDLQGSATSIRNFYKGFKPSWTDLIEDIPAVLQQYAQLSAEFRQGASEGKRFFPVTGPAGSGKSTFTKWLALKLSDESSRVYFVDKASQNTLEIIKELSRSNPSQNFFVFVERLDPIKQDIHDALDKVPNAIIIGPESQTVWSSRLVSEFDAVLTCKLLMHEIDEQDVPLILEKLQRFGPWTRLSNMTLNERKRELYVRSRRQLLIGLMETTTGVGFEEIINRDYEAIADKGDRLFFTAVCVSTMHKAALSLSVAARLLNSSGIARAPATMSSRLDGLVESRRDGFTARHPIYARKMIESVVSPEMIFSATTALLMAFTVYPHPVVTSLDKNDATLFKSLFNHKFLTSVLRIEANVLKFYSQFEKLFESDGLFWLQYGLALRDFKRHREAYDILQTAYNAYPHYHTTHALAQQKLILSASDLVTDSSARAYLAEAIKLLDGLDDTFESDDTYPIVTLAEGHVKALKVLDGVSVARIKASEYVRVLEQRLRRNSNARLDAARASLMSFSLTGNFKDEDWS